MSPVRQLGHGTDTGKKRRRNEDEYVVEPPLFAIADGMGGAQAGELASSLAAGAVRGGEGAAGGGEDYVVELIQEANRRVYQRSSQDAAVSGMGTTMTVELVEESVVILDLAELALIPFIFFQRPIGRRGDDQMNAPIWNP